MWDHGRATKQRYLLSDKYKIEVPAVGQGGLTTTTIVSKFNFRIILYWNHEKAEDKSGEDDYADEKSKSIGMYLQFYPGCMFDCPAAVR